MCCVVHLASCVIWAIGQGGCAIACALQIVSMLATAVLSEIAVRSCATLDIVFKDGEGNDLREPIFGTFDDFDNDTFSTRRTCWQTLTPRVLLLTRGHPLPIWF